MRAWSEVFPARSSVRAGSRPSAQVSQIGASFFDPSRITNPLRFLCQWSATAWNALGEEAKYGLVIRAKGYVPAPDGSWVHFDYTPGEKDVRTGPANIAGRVCVIGANLNESAAKELFGL